jgi:predicted regulator of Ras-like GTPase activity (Roadblock/LC7/MglB family)
VSRKVTDHVTPYLQTIKAVAGVENAVLVQQDGYPITSSGVWLSENEVFGVCSASAAILSVARRLHRDLAYVLIEGERSKFLLATLPTAVNYFLTTTTQSRTNLGALLLQLDRAKTNLDKALSHDEFVPPLRAFGNSEKDAIYQAFSLRESQQQHWSTGAMSLSITAHVASRIGAIVEDFLVALPSAQSGVVCLEGGYLIPSQRLSDGARARDSTLTYTLFDTSRKVAQLVKRTRIVQVLCDCAREQHFIYGLTGGLFSTVVSKDTTRLGLLRLVIPNYIAEIEDALQEAPLARIPSLDLNGFLEAIVR